MAEATQRPTHIARQSTNVGALTTPRLEHGGIGCGRLHQLQDVDANRARGRIAEIDGTEDARSR